MVGLGAGTVAAYGHPGESMTFFEINPAVVAVARDTHLFTYLHDSKADVHVVVGDGRLGLQNVPNASDDLIVLDAFSSDSIPVHLLTREAIEIYARELRPGGLLVFHISNNTFDLRPVLRAAADELGWTAIVGGSKTPRSRGDTRAPGSCWRGRRRTSVTCGSPGWSPLPQRSVAWTDDYSSVLRVLR